MTLEERLAELEAKVEGLEALMSDRPRRAFMQDAIRWNLPKIMPELQRRHPDGVTVKHVIAHFGYPLATTRNAIKGLAMAGRIVWTRRVGESEWIITLPGQPIRTKREMTASQQRLFDEICKLAVNGRLALSLIEIATAVGGNPNTVHYVMKCLQRQKKVRLIQRGTVGHPNVYFIPTAVTYTEDDARVDRLARRNSEAVWAA